MTDLPYHRFRKNYPGVPVTQTDDAGIPLSVWLALSSGSNQELKILKRKEIILYSRVLKWQEERTIQPFNPATLVWAAMIHDNYMEVAGWLRDVLHSAETNEKIQSVGEAAALLVFFVQNTIDEDGNLTCINLLKQVEDISERFYQLIPPIREFAKTVQNKEMYQGENIYNIFITSLVFNMPPDKVTREDLD